MIFMVNFILAEIARETCKYFDKKGLVMHCSSLSNHLVPGIVLAGQFPENFLTGKSNKAGT